MSYEFLGLAWVAVLSVGIGLVVAASPNNPFPKGLVIAAIGLRLVGSLARFDMIRVFYGGVADASRYFQAGTELAQRIWALDSSLMSYDFWVGGYGRWWGTEFMEKLAGVVLAVVGPSMRGGYLAFSMLSFVGLYLIALSIYRLRPGRGSLAFAGWIWLWPSLWFWPSSIGKEAVTLLAIGLVVHGYAGRGSGIRWLPFLLGLGLAFCIRPHVGAALAVTAAAAHWIGTLKRPGPLRLTEMLIAFALAALVFVGMLAQFGIEDPDLEGVQEFVAMRGQQTLEGGSSLGSRTTGIAAIPMAFVNIWLRPFPWDVHNLMALFSALEVLLLWWLVWRYRSRLKLVFKSWWRHRLLAFAVPFLVGYTLMIGLTFANLGIIARQRTPLFPFVFMMLTAGGSAGAERRRTQPLIHAPPGQRHLSRQVPDRVASVGRAAPSQAGASTRWRARG